MKVEDKVKNKFEELLLSSQDLKQGNEHGQIRNEQHRHACVGWLASAQNIVHLVVKSPENPYRTSVDKICAFDRGYCIQESVGEIATILKSLLQDVELGMLASIETQARASIYDSFLEHAKDYLGEKLKNEAGVISGVVFEDTLRNICRNNGLDEKDKSLEYLINALVKTNVIMQSTAKRAKAAAHVRTKATHAQWDEFEIEDVKTTIDFTDELILKHLEK